MLTDEQKAILPEQFQADIPATPGATLYQSTRHIEAIANALLELKEARELLKEMEWDFGYCWKCHALKRSGHYADCKVAKNLPEA